MTSETQTEWIEESRRLTLTVLANLASLAARSGSFRLGCMVRDLAEHAQLWAETVSHSDPGDHEGRPLDDEVLAEAATYAGRCAAGLRRRLDLGTSLLSLETERIAMACAADLDEHLGWADRVIRSLEQGGLSRSTRRCNVLLPSRSEFVADGPAAALAFAPPAEHRPAHENRQDTHEAASGRPDPSDHGGRSARGRTRPGRRRLGRDPRAESRLGPTATDP